MATKMPARQRCWAAVQLHLVAGPGWLGQRPVQLLGQLLGPVLGPVLGQRQQRRRRQRQQQQQQQ